MTPANREELIGMLTRGFATSGVAFWTDATTGELLDALDAAGLAIVLKSRPRRWSLRLVAQSSITLQGITTTLRGLSQNTAPCSKHHPLRRAPPYNRRSRESDRPN
jgi:hypothetical protein